MAEPARAAVAGEVVRVHLRIANSTRAHEVAGILREAGHLIADSSHAEVAVGDAEPNAFQLMGQNGSTARGPA